MRCDVQRGVWSRAGFAHGDACPFWDGDGHLAACNESVHELMSFHPSNVDGCNTNIFTTASALRTAFIGALGGRALRIIGDSLSADHFTYLTRCLLGCNETYPLKQTTISLAVPRDRHKWLRGLKDAGFENKTSEEAIFRLRQRHGDVWYRSGCNIGSNGGHVDFRRLDLFPSDGETSRHTNQTSKHPRLVEAMIHALVHLGGIGTPPREWRSSDIVMMNLGLHPDAWLPQHMDRVLSWWAKGRAVRQAPRFLWRQISPQHWAAPHGKYRTIGDVFNTTRCTQPDASESISSFLLYDRNITRLVEQAGADVLPIFNATWSRSDNHPPLRKGSVRLRNSAFDRAFANRTVYDCTHYCSRGSVLRFWTQALVSWLEE